MKAHLRRRRVTKRALITGITGQDGAYLAKYLLERGYEVHGAFRRCASVNTGRLEELGVASDIAMVALDLLEVSNIQRVIETTQPDEIYNLGGQSFVSASFEQPIYTGDVNALGAARLLETIRAVNPEIRYYQASSSEMFGKARETPQTEMTPFHPRSPYGVAKLYAHWFTVNYRETYGMHASSGILFNHESPLRGAEFVTRKITLALAHIRRGRQEPLELGNLDAVRDWGFAGDYVEGMAQMLQQPEGDDYILATGQTHTVREFVGQAAAAANFDIVWRGENEDAEGVDRRSGQVIARVNPQLYRPLEVDLVMGNPAKAKAKLGWTAKTSWEELVTMMMETDLRRVADAL